jgi:hypothetical protein
MLINNQLIINNPQHNYFIGLENRINNRVNNRVNYEADFIGLENRINYGADYNEDEMEIFMPVKETLIKMYCTYFINILYDLQIINNRDFLQIDRQLFIDLPFLVQDNLTLDSIKRELQQLNLISLQRKNRIPQRDISNNNTIIISRKLYNKLLELVESISVQIGGFDDIKNLIDTIFWPIDNWDTNVIGLINLTNILERLVIREERPPQIAYPNLLRVACTHVVPEDICIFCLSQYAMGEIQIILPCMHKFHEECILEWLNRDNPTCPTCRSQL